MNKVLIVEDEEIIRKGLVFMVDWARADCVVVGEASNGLDGLNKIRALRPDIVVTDIKMPYLNGIQMIDRGLKLHPFESIVISGYAEFEYAKSGIELGVSEYVLKPVEKEKIEQSLLQLNEKIRRKRLVESVMSSLGPQAETVAKQVELLAWKTGKTSTYTDRMIRHVEQHYQEKVSIKDLSVLLNASTTYLSQKFKEETTYTFNDFLNRYRIQKAVELLQSTNDRIYTIAEKTGFRDYKYFIHVFKKYIGLPPMEFSNAEHVIEYPAEKQEEPV